MQSGQYAAIRSLHKPTSLLLTAALVALCGCAQKPDDPKLTADLAPSAPVEAPARHAPPPRPPEVAKRVEQVVEKPEKKVAALDPATLVGMSPSSVGSALGKPTASHDDAMSAEWTYATKGCSLKIFFYPDIATGALRVLKYIVRNARGEAGDGPGCVHTILLARSDG